MRLCIDPAMVGGIHPGEHPGTIKIRDTRLNGFDLAALLRAQHPNAGWELGVWFLLTVGVVGLVGGFIAHHQIAELPWLTRRVFAEFWAWFSSPQIFLVAAAMFAAVTFGGALKPPAQDMANR